MVLSDSDVRALPKVELHCHIEGTMRAATVAELALIILLAERRSAAMKRQERRREL